MSHKNRVPVGSIEREVGARKHFRLYLFIDALIVGCVAGLIITAYRIGISEVSHRVRALLGFATDGGITHTATWFAVMIVLGVLASLCWKIAPMISGSGIPQVSAQMAGLLKINCWLVLPFKFIGGLFTLGGGLTLGREGPSVQIGAATGQAWGELSRRPLSERDFLISSGAAAGLAAAFNAPIAGVVFALEELHRSFSSIVLVGATTAAFTGAFIADLIMGFAPVLPITGHEFIPLNQYWLVIAVGIATGLSGVFFNKIILLGKAIYAKLKLNWLMAGIVPFLITAVACIIMPELFGSGEPMIFFPIPGGPMGANPSVQHLVMLYALKITLLTIAFGSGLPGGIFFPLLVLGSLVGNILGQSAVLAGLMQQDHVLTIALMAMAGHFAAIVRSPLTGILLISEMTGSFAFMLPLGVTAMVAYAVAEIFRSEPIYESLRNLLPLKHDSSPEQATPAKRKAKNAHMHTHVMLEFEVERLSPADNKIIADLTWPEETLVIAVKRGSSSVGEEIVPNKKTRLSGGDHIVVLIPSDRRAEIQEYIKNTICNA